MRLCVAVVAVVAVAAVLVLAPRTTAEFNVSYPVLGVRPLPPDNTSPCSDSAAAATVATVFRGTINNFTLYMFAPELNRLISPVFIPSGASAGSPVANPVVVAETSPGFLDVEIPFPVGIALLRGVLQFEYDATNATYYQCIDVAIADVPVNPDSDDVIVLGMTAVPFSFSIVGLAILCLLLLLLLLCCRRRRRRKKREAEEAAHAAAAASSHKHKRKRRRKVKPPGGDPAASMTGVGPGDSMAQPRRTRVHKRTKTRVIDGPDGTKILKKIVEVVESSDEWGDSGNDSSALDSSDADPRSLSKSRARLKKKRAMERDADPEATFRYGSTGSSVSDDSSYDYEVYEK